MRCCSGSTCDRAEGTVALAFVAQADRSDSSWNRRDVQKGQSEPPPRCCVFHPAARRMSWPMLSLATCIGGVASAHRSHRKTLAVL